MNDPTTFTTTLEKVAGVGGWYIVRLPAGVLEKMKIASGKNGNQPVIVSVGKSSWPSTTMSMGNQQWFIAIKSSVRKHENLGAGDSVTVRLVPDTDRLP
jgi:hypothetical protein